MKEKPKKKKVWKKILLLLAALFVLFLMIPTEEETEEFWSGGEEAVLEETDSTVGRKREEAEADSSRPEAAQGTNAKWTTDLKAKEATVLLYLMGSDLETQAGCASADIEEILAADLGEQVNVVIQTGGSTYWYNDEVAADSVQRFSVEAGELVLKEDLGLISMVDKSTLSDFISWGVKNYPADRTILILWNHGGGTIAGYGYDEYFEGTLYLSDLAKALEDAGTHFDIIGFDACLMATIETAFAMAPYTDYLIVSEETEPGTGWYYTDWLSLLGENPGVNMAQLSQQIVDDYVYGPDSSFWDSTTLTAIDTEKIDEVYEALCEFMSQSSKELNGYGYQTLSVARSDAKSYGEGEYEQVDILDYVEKTGQEGSEEIEQALKELIVYHDANISETHGLAMYFPYNYPEYYQNMLDELNRIGMQDTSYQDFFNEFISRMVHGQSQSSGSLSPMEQLTGYVDQEESFDYTGSNWYQAEVEQEYVYALETLGSGELYLAEKNGDYVLQLSDEEWETITYMELQVLIDDGEGYLDLGSDNVYEFNEDGDLLVDFDYSWVALDGQIVPFYALEEGERVDGSWYTYGYVPAELTRASDGENMDIEILVYWDDEHMDGYVTGYRYSTWEELFVAERNLLKLETGDILDFYCDYYTYDGEYEASYYFGDSVTVWGELEVSYKDLEEYPTQICYYLQDIYCNEYWTETISIYFE